MYATAITLIVLGVIVLLGLWFYDKHWGHSEEYEELGYILLGLLLVALGMAVAFVRLIWGLFT